VIPTMAIEDSGVNPAHGGERQDCRDRINMSEGGAGVLGGSHPNSPPRRHRVFAAPGSGKPT